MEQGEERENGFLSTVPERFCRFRLRARKEITSAFETARKLPRFDRSQGVGVLVNTSPLAIVEPRGFGAVSNWEVISLRALRAPKKITSAFETAGKLPRD